MKKPITVKAHLSIETIETRYRKAKDAVERSHWQIIWLLAVNCLIQWLMANLGEMKSLPNSFLSKMRSGNRLERLFNYPLPPNWP